MSKLVASVLFALLLCSETSFALSAKDRKVIQVQLDRIVKTEIGDDKYASEYRKARSFVERPFLNPPSRDVFVFFTIEGEGGGNHYSYYLALFTKAGDNYRLVASSAVGGKNKQIDFGYVKVEGKTFVLRSGDFHDLMIEEDYGVRKIYYQWWLDGTTLRSDEKTYKRESGRWVPVKSRWEK